MSSPRTTLSLLPAALAVLLVASPSHADVLTDATWTLADSGAFNAALPIANAAPGGVQEVSVTDDGEWMVISANGVERSSGFPYIAEAYVNYYRYVGRTIDAVAVSPQGGVVVAAEDMLYVSYSGIPQRSLLYSQLDSLRDAGVTIEDVVFDPDGFGWAIAAGEDSSAWSAGDDITTALNDAADGGRPVHQITLSPDGRFGVVAGDWFHVTSDSWALHSVLGDWQIGGQSIDQLVLGPAGFTLAVSNGAFTAGSSGIDQVEASVLPGTNLWSRMDQLGVVGVSVAIIDGGEITARSYGYADTETWRHLTPSTGIEAASLSKSVTAMGMLTLVDDELISLDDDLVDDVVPAFDSNDDFRAYLDFIEGKSYAPPSGIQLRMLLNHTAGLNYTSGSAYDLMDGPDRDLLTLAWGYRCNPRTQSCWFGSRAAMRTGYSPGAQYDYSATGYLYAQGVIEGVTGQPMEDEMVDRVLAPLGMSDTTFDTAFVAANPEWFSYTHASDGQPVKGAERAAFRWLGAGGMYTTPRDMARFLITIDNGGTDPEGGFVVSTDAVDELLAGSAMNSRYALGLRRTACSHVVETDRPGEIWHGGRHSGLLTGRTWAIDHDMRYRPALDQGIVVMINGGGRNNTPQGGMARDAARVLRDEIVARFQQVYGWTNDACNQVPATIVTPGLPSTPSLPGGWGWP